MPNLYIIAGPNGAGKTTASYTILPELLHCNEFVNADEIAKGLSPFNVEKVAFEAGRIMLERINHLLKEKTDFAFETTLSTKSYVSFIKKAKENGYKVTLIFLWLDSPKIAKVRVRHRVKNGGHNIPSETIERRYKRGLGNFLSLYKPIVDQWLLINNTFAPEEIAKCFNEKITIQNKLLWKKISHEK